MKNTQPIVATRAFEFFVSLCATIYYAAIAVISLVIQLPSVLYRLNQKKFAEPEQQTRPLVAEG
jgi:hypothetical protein